MCGCFEFHPSDGNLAITSEVDLVHTFGQFPFLRNELALRCTVLIAVLSVNASLSVQTPEAWDQWTDGGGASAD